MIARKNRYAIFRCDRAGLAGTIRLAAVRCPAGLAFDIDKQTCDWKSKVESCDRLSSMSIIIVVAKLIFDEIYPHFHFKIPPIYQEI